MSNLKHDEVLSYFSSFGDVQNVRIHNKPKNSYGFVEFASAVSAAKALAVDVHIIAGRRVNVAASDSHQEEATSLNDDATNLPKLKDHKTRFLDLNDDCIVEILSMKCLAVRDLCSASETCRRLKEIASRVFKREKEHKECGLYSLSEGESELAKRILMNFGTEICLLRILFTGTTFDRATFDLSNLNHLKILFINCAQSEVSVETLGLENLKFLEHLTIASGELDLGFVRTLPQLQRLQVLELTCFTGLRNLNQIGGFCELTTLKISSFQNEPVDVVDVAVLVKRLSKLTHLDVEVRGLELDLETYLRIVDAVRQRPDKSKLKFRLRIDYGEVNYDHLREDFSRNAHLVEMIIDIQFVFE